MKKLPVAEHLTDQEYSVLLKVYADHNSSMGFAERVNYTASHISRVESDPENQCLKVFYTDGNWWHYSYSGTWY